VQSTLVFASATVEIPQIEVGRCIVRVTGYGELVRAASFIDLAACKQNVAPVQVRPSRAAPL